MDKNTGWVSLHRKIQNNWIWEDREPFDRRSAWIDLILLANHETAKVRFDNDFITVEAGQHLTSIRKLSERWKWSKDKVAKFLKLLEKDNMIVCDSNKRRTLLTVVNYGDYQDKQDSERTVNGHKTDSERTVNGHKTDSERTVNGLNNNDNNDNNENNDNKKDIDTTKVVSCTEQSNGTITDYILSDYSLPLNNGKYYTPDDMKITEWMNVFQGVDILQEFKEMRLWLDDNPQKRKTQRGINRFISSWLGREQDKQQQSRAVSTYQKPNSTTETMNLLQAWVEEKENE